MGLTAETMRRLINQRDAAPKNPRHWLLQENQRRAQEHLLYRSYPTDFDQDLPVNPEWTTIEKRRESMRYMMQEVARLMSTEDFRLW